MLSRFLVGGYFLGREGDLLELFLLFDSTLILLGAHKVLLVELSVQFAPVTLLHVFQSLAFCLHPLLTPPLLLLYAVLD